MRYIIVSLCALGLVVGQIFYGGGGGYAVFGLPTFLIVAVTGLLAIFTLRSDPGRGDWVCLGSVLAFAGWMVWRELEAPDPYLAASYLRLTLACLIVYLIFAWVVTDVHARLAFICVLFVLGIGQTVLGVWQVTHADGPQMFPWFAEKLRVWYSSRYGVRAQGTYINPNHLAWALNMAGIFALSLTCWGRWGIKTKVVTFYIMLVCFAGVVASMSRGAVLGLGVGIGVFFLLAGVIVTAGASGRRLVATTLSVTGLAAVGITLAILYSGSFHVRERFGRMLDDGYRESLFWSAIREFQLDPIFGAGPGMFLYFSRQYRQMLMAADDMRAHNDWLQILADFGFPAVVLLLAVLFIHYRAAIGGLLVILRERMSISSRPQSHSAAISVGAMCCLAMFITHSFFDFNMQIPVNALMAAACLGMMANPGRVGGRRNGWQGRSGQLVAYAVVCIISGWLLSDVVKVARPEYLFLQAENAYFRSKDKEAEVFAKDGLTLSPSSPALYGALGQVYLWRASLSTDLDERRRLAVEAARAFQEVVRLSPKNQNGVYLYGVALSQSDRYAGASGPLIESIALNPADVRGYEAYGLSLEALNKLEEAENIYLVAQPFPYSEISRRRLDVVRNILRSREAQ